MSKLNYLPILLLTLTISVPLVMSQEQNALNDLIQNQLAAGVLESKNVKANWRVRRTINLGEKHAKIRIMLLERQKARDSGKISPSEERDIDRRIEHIKKNSTKPSEVDFSLDAVVGDFRHLFATQKWLNTGAIYEYYFTPSKGVRIDLNDKTAEPFPVDTLNYPNVLNGLLTGLPYLLIENLRFAGNSSVDLWLDTGENPSQVVGDIKKPTLVIGLSGIKTQLISKIKYYYPKGVILFDIEILEWGKVSSAAPRKIQFTSYSMNGEVFYVDVWELLSIESLPALDESTFVWRLRDGFTVPFDGYGNRIDLKTDDISK